MLFIRRRSLLNTLIATAMVHALSTGCASPVVDPDTGPRPDVMQMSCPTDVPVLDVPVVDDVVPDFGVDVPVVTDAPALTDAVDVTCSDGSALCGSACADLTNDIRNCGACANACPAGSPCAAGLCGVNCQAGLLRCGSICIDPLTNRDSCGATGSCLGSSAGTTCTGPQVCLAGVCRIPCPPPQINCGGLCVDPMTTAAYCGALGDCTNGGDGGVNSAGRVCGSGMVCSGGTCGASCGAGQINCAGVCTDPRTSQTHCGATTTCTGATNGVACAAGEFCIGGVCQVSCGAGLVNCGGTCIDPLRNTAYCGASGTCAAANAGTVCGSGEICLAGQCLFYEAPRTFSSPGVSGNGGALTSPFPSWSFAIDSPTRGTIVYTLDGSTPNPGMAGTLMAPAPFRVNVGAPVTVRWYADYGALGRELDFHGATLSANNVGAQNEHGIVVENVNINMTGRAVALVAPGSVVRVSAAMSFWHANAAGYCQSCVSFVGVHVDSTPGSPPITLDCANTGGPWPGVQRAPRMWMFTAPMVRGRYPIRLSLALDYRCTGPGSTEVGEVIVR